MQTTETTTATSAKTTAAAALAADGQPDRRRRRAARIAAVALAAGSFVGALAGPAFAESPPAPEPGPQIAAPDPGPLLPGLDLNYDVGKNTHKVWNIQTKTGDTFGDVTFLSDAPTMVVQTSKTKPYWVGDKLTMGAVQPQYLVGKHVAGTPGGFALTKVYSYSITRDGLTPATTYYNVFSIPGIAGQAPNYNSSALTTKTRYVRMTPLSIHVSDDADHGLRGKGEIRFGFRVAPDAGPLTPSWWDQWTSEMKLDSGADVDVSKLGLGKTYATKKNQVHVQVQGRENDVDAHDWDCAIQGEEKSPEQYSDHCYDMSYAEGLAQLPTGRYTGAHKQIVDAKVTRSPALVFQSKVLVETWYA